MADRQVDRGIAEAALGQIFARVEGAMPMSATRNAER